MSLESVNSVLSTSQAIVENQICKFIVMSLESVNSVLSSYSRRNSVDMFLECPDKEIHVS